MSRRPFIIDAAKSTIGDTDPADDAQRCASRASKKQRRAPDGQPKVAPRGLATDELLAKIDALDWDDPMLPATVPPAETTDAGTSTTPPRSRLPAVLIGAAALLLAGGLVLYQVLVAGETPRPSGNSNQLAVAAPSVVAGAEVSPGASGADDADRVAAVEAEERLRAAKFAQAVSKAEENALRKAEKQRKAREAEQARLEQEQQQQQQQQQERRRQEEEARQRAEREAAEARAKVPAPAPAPRGPASPQELCAEESNFFSRGLCEGRACGRPEWQSHPFCVKRTEDQLRRISPGG